MTSPSLQDLTSDQLTGLSPQLRRAAQFVLGHPDEIATRSLRQIAEAAQLPPPTFSRLARAIGFDSYDALRETCRDDIRRRRSQFADRALALVDGTQDNADTPFLVRHAAAAMKSTQRLLEQIDHEALGKVARTLAAARSVALIGAMSARAFVDYGAYLAAMSLPGWRVIGSGGKSLGAELADLGPEDAAIAFSIAPYAARTVDIAHAVVGRQTPLIALTDTPLSPIAAKAQTTFVIGTQSPQFFPSHVAATVFIEALIGMVVREKGADAQQRIAAIEQRSHTLNDYWQDPSAATPGRHHQ